MSIWCGPTRSHFDWPSTPTQPSDAQLNAELDQTVDPTTDAELAQLTALHARDGLAERAHVARLARGWSQFVALRGTGVLASQRSTSDVTADADRLSRQISTIFDPLNAITQTEAALEATQAGQAHARAAHTYHTSMLLIWAIAVAALLLGVGSMLLLTRNVVPRVRRYSQFASAVAGGDLSSRLTPRGSDELTTLGRALNEMVERRSVGAKHQAVQSEFVDALQVTDREEIAHDLLRRQVERSIPDSSVVVLNRNNSENRLEATTKLRENSSLKQTLIDAKPRSCMAVLFARPHREEPEHEPLTHCEICGKTGGRTTCEPLLVGGEVIGSVLVEHPEPLGEQDTTALRESVAQAAPVLANLRNLALAEFRASTDGLTGLPNKRAIQDTIKRMTAQASRTVSPLSAIAFDLDHFKQINDSYGHGRGDDVLASVGAVLSETVRSQRLRRAQRRRGIHHPAAQHRHPSRRRRRREDPRRRSPGSPSQESSETSPPASVSPRSRTTPATAINSSAAPTERSTSPRPTAGTEPKSPSPARATNPRPHPRSDSRNSWKPQRACGMAPAGDHPPTVIGRGEVCKCAPDSVSHRCRGLQYRLNQCVGAVVLVGKVLRVADHVQERLPARVADHGHGIPVLAGLSNQRRTPARRRAARLHTGPRPRRCAPDTRNSWPHRHPSGNAAG